MQNFCSSEDPPQTRLEWQWTIHRLQVSRSYASSAWSGFANKRHEQRIATFLRRNKKCGLCQPDLPSFQELCDVIDEQHFDKILHSKQHLVDYLLPPSSAASQSYNLWRRSHSQLLPHHPGHLMDSNFITRMLYKNIYWCYHTHTDYIHYSRTNW